ncbi:MAG: sigma-70 family RNA polymerase sigma factor [Anaeromyxobacter sp.]|nr:sigma-70 family RNA polymerase sigma factor [Anaeromyxobacter sp.]MBL0274876.1 sigma-70 family RNA polymerase sigma factor [Anaeromyxobacter sp.]
MEGPSGLLDGWYRGHAVATARRWRSAGGDGALDLLHDAIVDLLERPAAAIRSPVGYLLAAARTLAADAGRRGRRAEALRAGLASASATARQADGALEARAALRALDGLPRGEREALWLNRFDGLGHEEIAARQEVCVRTVQRRIERALAHLAAAAGREAP